jgi:hypothetical protein
MLSIAKVTTRQAHAAGRQDSHHFMSLYRAYLRGASEAAGAYQENEHDHSFKMAVAAMIFALLSWFITIYFVFK